MIKPEMIENLMTRMRDAFQFFHLLSDDELREFLSYCEFRQVTSGVLWDEGEIGNYAAFMVSGKVGVKKETEFEGRYMIVGSLSPGAVIGELCLLNNVERSASAVVLDPVDMVTLDNQNFEQLMVKYPHLGLKVLRHIFLVLAGRLRKSNDRLAKIF